MAIIAVAQNQKVKSFEDIKRDALNQYVYKELRYPLLAQNSKALHRAVNQFFGDGTAIIPQGYYDEHGEIVPVRYGRCRDELIEISDGVKHHFINTFILPDGKVHVIIIDTVYQLSGDE